MNPSLSRRELIAYGSVSSIGVLAGCQELTGSDSRDTSSSPNRDQETPTTNQGSDSESGRLGLAFSQSRLSYPSESDIHSGWVHIVSDGESADLTFDARFCSGIGDVEPKLTNSFAQEYTLDFESSAVSDEKSVTTGSPDDSACSSVLRLVGGANVPRDWQTLVVSVNGATIQTIEKSGTMPEFRPLPDPIQFK